jgi:hypothetical protein
VELVLKQQNLDLKSTTSKVQILGSANQTTKKGGIDMPEKLRKQFCNLSESIVARFDKAKKKKYPYETMAGVFKHIVEWMEGKEGKK